MENQNQIIRNGGGEETAQEFVYDDEDDDAAYLLRSPSTFTGNEDYDAQELQARVPQLLLSTGDGPNQRLKDVEPEVPKINKEVHESPSTERSRAAAIHNISESSRRDRRYEKVKVLRELIPHCNKTDMASVLDDAIEYMRTLQNTALEMMSVRYGTVSMMYPGMGYMPSMTTGINMVAGTNGPIMPYPLHVPASSEHLTPEFPIPTFHQPIAQPANQVDALFNWQQLQVPIAHPHQMPNFHLYQPYYDVRPSQLVLPQNQDVIQQTGSEPRSSSENNQNNDDIPYSG